MEVTQYKVVGVDESRPPLIQPRPCIDLVFQLNEEAPRAWCEEFQAITGKQPFSITLDPEIGLHIETWVRKPEQVAQSLDNVKSLVALANEAYMKRLTRESQVVVSSDDSEVVISPAQKALNDVVAGLVFETD